MIVIAALALIVFGPKKLPEIGRSVGNALREFKRASSEFMDAVNNPDHEQEYTPPPVQAIEYPTTPALSEPESFESLPYGSDFHPAETASVSAPHEAPHALENGAHAAQLHPENGAHAGEPQHAAPGADTHPTPAGTVPHAAGPSAQKGL